MGRMAIQCASPENMTPALRAYGMTLDSEALGRAYSPSSVAPDFLQTLQSYGIRSEEVRTALGKGTVLRYGPAERETVTRASSLVPGCGRTVYRSRC